MRIVVLGATGNIGSRFIDKALMSGHEIVAYVRQPDKIANQRDVTIFPGELDDVSTLTQASLGADAMLLAVAGPIRDGSFMQQRLPGIVTAAKDAGVNRLVLISAFGSGDTAEKASWLAEVIYRSAFGRLFDDKARSEEILPASGLNYTIVYPVNLKDASAVADAQVVDLERVASVPGMPTLPFENVAAELVEIITNPDLNGQRLLITTQNGWKPA